MQCKCGFRISSPESRKNLLKDGESFAIVRDKDWAKLMRLEKKYLEAPKGEKLKVLSRCARYVGSIYECPQCSRLIVLKPGAEAVEFYAREA